MDRLLDRDDDLSAEELLAKREGRIRKAIRLEAPDRTPINLSWNFFTARQAGMTNRDAMYDSVRLSAAGKAAMLTYRPDSYLGPHLTLGHGEALEIIDFQALAWPGYKLPDNVPFQYIDKEYMSAAEYDDFLFDPSGFIIKNHLPRVAGKTGGFAKLPDFSTMLHSQVLSLAVALNDPEVAETLETLKAAGKVMIKVRAEAAAYAAEMERLGFPSLVSGLSTAPFDQISDFMRGSKGAMLDMFRNKDKLLEVLEKVTETTIRSAMAQKAAMKQGGRANLFFIPMHWGLDGFMSPAQFKTFYWPQFRRVLMALIEAGLVPVVFWEGDVGSRLEIIADIPPGSCVYKFERTDLFRAKDVLGGVVCIQGNVPATMLIASTPDEVDAHCRKLIEEVGKDGGFILDSSTGVPEESKPANVAAMAASVRKYNPYK